MKGCLVVFLVGVSIVLGEPLRQNAFQRQEQPQAPYNPRGWRPQGAAFNLPTRSQPQQTYGPPQPAPSYGPPPQEYGPPPEPQTEETPTTTEYPTGETTTEFEPQIENLQIDPRNQNSKSRSSQLQEPSSSSGQLFLVVPQGENLLYLPVATPQKPARLQALPVPLPRTQPNRYQANLNQAEGRLQPRPVSIAELEQYRVARLRQLPVPFSEPQQVARLQALPVPLIERPQRVRLQALPEPVQEPQTSARLQALPVPIVPKPERKVERLQLLPVPVQQSQTQQSQPIQTQIVVPAPYQQLPALSTTAVFTPYSGSIVQIYQ